jgi:hypothetical protein
MERERVKSSVIRAIAFDERTRTLEVEFHTGKVYRYLRVPRSEYEKLRRAASVGSYFNRQIRTQFRAVVRRGE